MSIKEIMFYFLIVFSVVATLTVGVVAGMNYANRLNFNNALESASIAVTSPDGAGYAVNIRNNPHSMKLEFPYLDAFGSNTSTYVAPNDRQGLYGLTFAGKQLTVAPRIGVTNLTSISMGDDATGVILGTDLDPIEASGGEIVFGTLDMPTHNFLEEHYLVEERQTQTIRDLLLTGFSFMGSELELAVIENNWTAYAIDDNADLLEAIVGSKNNFVDDEEATVALDTQGIVKFRFLDLNKFTEYAGSGVVNRYNKYKIVYVDSVLNRNQARDVISNTLFGSDFNALTDTEDKELVADAVDGITHVQVGDVMFIPTSDKDIIKGQESYGIFMLKDRLDRF